MITKIKEWLKDKYNLAFFLVLTFGIILRLIYLVITKNQPLWWDEAEYILIGKHILGSNLITDFLASRPLLLPILWAFFIKIGLGSEIIFRIIEFLISSIGLIFMYLTTKELFNKETGIVSTLLLSVFYLHLFYGSRLLLDSIAPTFWLISIYFFTKGYLLKKHNKKLYLSAFFGAIGVFFYNQTIALFVIYLVFLLLVEKLNLFKEKRFYIFGLVALLTFSPNFLLNQQIFNNPFEFVTAGISTGNIIAADYSANIKEFTTYFPNYLGTLFLILFLISLVIVFYKIIIGIDLVIKNPDLEQKKELLLLLWLLISFFLIIKIVGHFEDRYIMPTFIPIFIITSLGLYKIKEYFTKLIDKNVVYGIIIVLLVIISFTNLKQADNIIKLKKDSFSEIRDGGRWIKENSNQEDKIIASQSPMLLYYSDRKIISLPETEEEFKKTMQENKPKYLVISAFTSNPSYVGNLINYTNLKPAQVYQAGNNLILAVFEVLY